MSTVGEKVRFDVAVEIVDARKVEDTRYLLVQGIKKIACRRGKDMLRSREVKTKNAGAGNRFEGESAGQGVTVI